MGANYTRLRIQKLKGELRTTINFYSYKGGVGRTMLTAQIARILAAVGKNIVVADFDFDAPGILPAFNVGITDADRGICELSMEFLDTESFDEPAFKNKLEALLKNGGYLREIPTSLNSESGKTGRIRILPSGHICKEYWENLTRRDWMDFCTSSPPTPNP